MKRLSFSIIMILLIIAASDMPHANVTGECVNCHTMHDSQGGAPMATYGGISGANPCLTRGDCIDCHAYNISGTANVVNIGGSLVPQVWHNAAADLAGGNFKYIATGTNDDKGHNVAAINQEGNTSMFPQPGDQHGAGITAANFTCAGQYGCHGDRSVPGDIESMRGAHHANDSVIDGISVGTSYRFLKGVLGLENPVTAWRNVSATDHNEYKGATSPGVSSLTSPANGTMSGFCAQCHGFYHGSGIDETGGSASPWIRHPTDFSLPGSGEYASYTTYSVVAPVARVAIPIAPSGTVDPTKTDDDILMCLSCHGAHATNYYKLMRWDNKANNSGCVVCHTSKN